MKSKNGKATFPRGLKVTQNGRNKPVIPQKLVKQMPKSEKRK